MIYFLDKDMKIIEAMHPLGNIQTQELPEDESLLKNYVHVTIENDEDITKNANYIAMKAHEGYDQSFELFEIIDDFMDDYTTEFQAIDIGTREFSGYIVKDIRPQNRTVRYVAQQLLAETEWRVGFVSDKLSNISTNFYYLNVKDSLIKLQQVAGCEILFRVEISGNEVTDKWIEIHQQIGTRNAHRFEYGTSALEITRQNSTSDVYTALIGRGNGEEVGDGYGRKITFEDLEREYKPKGQDYVENELATQLYGIRTSNGMRPRFGIIDFDTDDREELLDLTWAELDKVSRPKSEFKTTVANIGPANIGDSATIHKHEIGMHYETRIRKLVRDRVHNKNTDITLGDYILSSEAKRRASYNSTIKAIEGKQEEQQYQITNTIQTADGFASVTYGNVEPEKKKVGDLWYRDNPQHPERTEIVIWNGEAWEKTDRTDKLHADIQKATEDVEEANRKADAVTKEITDALAGTGHIKLSDLIASKIGDEEASTLFFQKAKDIGLAYEENGVVKAMIGILDGNIYQQGEQIVFNGDDIIANGTLTVTEDMFAEGITFDWATGQTLDVNDITLVNLNMKNIAGGNIELSEGFKITNNGHEILSIDAQTGRVIFDVAGVPTTDDLDTAIGAVDEKINTKADNETVDKIDERVSGTESIVEHSSESIKTLKDSLLNYSQMLDGNKQQISEAKQGIANLLDREVIIQENLGKFSKELNFINTRITHGDEGIVIQNVSKEGKYGRTKIAISDKSILFMDGNVEVASITGNTLIINHGVFTNTLQVGEHHFQTIRGHTIVSWIRPN